LDLAMNDFGLFLSVDGYDAAGECLECKKRGPPVVVLNERFFGDGAPGCSKPVAICEKCLDTYVHHLQESISSGLRTMFGKKMTRQSTDAEILERVKQLMRTYHVFVPGSGRPVEVVAISVIETKDGSLVFEDGNDEVVALIPRGKWDRYEQVKGPAS
jgi:hypothetical protein